MMLSAFLEDNILNRWRKFFLFLEYYLINAYLNIMFANERSQPIRESSEILDGLHFSQGMRDVELTETSVLMKALKSAAVVFLSEFRKSGMGTGEFHHSYHIFSAVRH